MATRSRDLAKIFCEALGVDPGVVRSFKLEADAKDGIVVATVVIYPTFSDKEIEALAKAALEHGSQFLINLVGDDDGTA